MKIKKTVIFSGIIFFIIVAFSLFDLFIAYPYSPQNGSFEDVLISINKGEGPRIISDKLEKNKIINSAYKFSLWIRFSKKIPRLRAGDFVLRGDMTPLEIFNTLSNVSSSKGIRVTIPEGFTIDKISRLFDEMELVSYGDFIKAATDPLLLAELKVEAPSFEGFLFPDTYYFFKDVTSQTIIKKMNSLFKKKFKSIEGSETKDMLKTVTLASIVQAEAKIMEEAPIIAGVYTNRLDKKIFPSLLLQADPTVSYGCNQLVKDRSPVCLSFLGKLTRRELKDKKNIYNTYVHKGLPPGPICSPGKDALKAAIHPKKVPYIFFVASKNGHHKFSTTLKQHNIAVKKYIKKLD
ncbi:MAG: endolytic transglycosylase MltG [Deltaproteobacteria bacterium]|nr:endolytic transglycosylase MltG [Deltaproteobacteria bacterium]